MLSLSNITHTIWEYNSHGWSIVVATQGTYDEATERADELKTCYPDSEFAVRTASPIAGERLKQSRYYGKTPDGK